MKVFVELDANKTPIRILSKRDLVAKILASIGDTVLMEKALAVKSIRGQIFIRSNGDCEWCGTPITWNGFHMHERVFRGKGGDISVENSVAICADCHINRNDSAHGDRKPRFKHGDGEV